MLIHTQFVQAQFSKQRGGVGGGGGGGGRELEKIVPQNVTPLNGHN
jgi:hypothetical protein